MFSLREPRNHTLIPVNENAVRQTNFSPAQVLRRAGFDNAEHILAALEKARYVVEGDMYAD